MCMYSQNVGFTKYFTLVFKTAPLLVGTPTALTQEHWEDNIHPTNRWAKEFARDKGGHVPNVAEMLRLECLLCQVYFMAFYECTIKI